jgi:hypothetical protein
LATDYDAPRKNDDDTESLDALKERAPDALGASADLDEGDHSEILESHDIAEDLEVVVVPKQDDEFTCSECFIVKHKTQLAAKKGKYGQQCLECAN